MRKSNFREWLGQSELSEVETWFSSFSSRVASSIRPSEGYISVSISSLPTLAPVTPISASGSISPVDATNHAPMTLAASVVHLGDLIEVTEKGWKGKAAVKAANDMGLGWNAKDTTSFFKGMNAGKRSIPTLVGREMGLLFEVEIFSFLVTTFNLKVVGDRDLAWASTEKIRIVNEISGKVGVNLGRLVVDFVVSHATGKTGMGNLIYSKAMSLVRKCIVDSIEFKGGEGGRSAKLRSDTADLRIGCEKYLPGVRSDVGFSLKAVTESQVMVRDLGFMKALSILGASRSMIRNIKNIEDVSERRDALLEELHKAAEKSFANKPRKFASLLDLLVTGGADTIPAYRSLLQADSSPGWSNAIGKDFVTGEGPGKKLGAKIGSSPNIEVKSNSTYVKITYMVGGGNHYGTSVQFEPSADARAVSVVVSNLINRRVK